jgi:Pentapeptide repeats (8 copies)
LAASVQHRLRSEIQPSRAGGFRAASVTQKRPLLNHAHFYTVIAAALILIETRNQLEGANLSRADLEGANLYSAHLDRMTNLAFADLKWALLERTDFQGAFLTHTVGLSETQLLCALGNAATRLPAGLTRPADWPPRDSDWPPAVWPPPAAEARDPPNV